MDAAATSPSTWAAVDAFVQEQLFEDEPVLAAALARSQEAGLPTLAISPGEGRFLELLVRMTQSRRLLELGTLGGYSAIWLARGLPEDGFLLSLEKDSRYADVARRNIAAAGLGDRVEVRVGDASEALRQLRSEGAPPFDLVFLDADKRSNPVYLKGALALARPGTVIVADNVVRGGAILDPCAEDQALGEGGIEGLRRFFALLGAEPGVTATVIQTVGAKGHDGFAIARVERVANGA